MARQATEKRAVTGGPVAGRGMRGYYLGSGDRQEAQVEIWFTKIERDVIARGVFTSVPDLARKLRRYINAYSANAQPHSLEILRR